MDLHIMPHHPGEALVMIKTVQTHYPSVLLNNNYSSALPSENNDIYRGY